MSGMIVFDGNSILNRAFYGIRPLNTKDGFPTNALFGFINILLKNLQSGYEYAVIAYDLRAKTFRHKACDTYKATRKGMPEELAKQLPVSKQLSEYFGIKVVEKEGYEADDILGTISQICANNKIECTLVTGDRDSYQLVRDGVTVFLAANNETKIITPDTIKELYSLDPR
ncbi:MAG: DNA polymerase I, partial [Clostridia bacterium]